MVKNLVSLLIGISSFFYTFYVIYYLIYFTSGHNENHEAIQTTEDELLMTIIRKLLINLYLLFVFMIQHSVMASKFVKSLYKKLFIPEYERSIYNALSSLCLDYLIRNWEPVPWIALWEVDTASNNYMWILFSALHLFGWSVIFSGCCVLDVTELLGLKQIYCKLINQPGGLAVKSKEYQRYLDHMRHPSFVGFMIIFWIHPYMTIDRFLLSSIMTIYMLMMWKIDENDYYYASNVYYKEEQLFKFQ
ncbi:nurim homolog [Microplitis demolitor]|uniref:nurim homolog n=1 Tax=Microplitis demolitor TaxID=69319 RepID=UPI0004CCEC9B|nr:nurim homolog [Microplitis demolitor]